MVTQILQTDSETTIERNLSSRFMVQISCSHKKSQDCLKNSLNPKLIPKIPRSGEKSQAVEALRVSSACFNQWRHLANVNKNMI